MTHKLYCIIFSGHGCIKGFVCGGRLVFGEGGGYKKNICKNHIKVVNMHFFTRWTKFQGREVETKKPLMDTVLLSADYKCPIYH